MSKHTLFTHTLWNRRAVGAHVSRARNLLFLLVYLISLAGVPGLSAKAAGAITFTGTELLGRPEANAISVSVVPDANISLYYEYGVTSGVYTGQTPTVSATGGQPQVVTISGLTANTRYYYRMQYSSDGGATWVARPEHSFQTKRAAGSTFTFDVTSDSHVNIQLGNASNWTSTLNGVASDNADFLIDLGDTFAMDNGSTSVTLGDVATAEQRYKDALPFFNTVSASSPLFIVSGNHEQQEAWHLQGTLANSLPVMSKNAEKKFYLNPVNDAFYSGDTSAYPYLSGDQLKQDYYAWTWGDALFVVISPYWTTTTKPYTTSAGGGETDATGSGERWDWTLGLEQFNWLKATLEGSPARYKFVFAHQIVGGNGMTSPVNQVNYGHGGVDSANFVEWGGYNVDGVTYAWDTRRPGWGSQPIRQMMEANGVTAFFHGHDHQFAYESLNGMVYQAVPSGSFTGSFGSYTTGGNSGKTIWADSTQGPGHLRVTVSPSQTTVDFIRYNGTSPAYTYNMAPTGGPSYTLTVSADPSDAGTTAPEVGTHSYLEGSVVDVTATPAPGYQFDYWSGACTGSGACQVTMEADQTVTAHFKTVPPGNVTYVGDIGAAVVKTSGASLAITTSAAVAAGDDIFIVYATDPNQNVSPINVTDAAGNTYSEVGYALNSGQLRTYLFAAYDANELSAGSSITITANAAVTARAAVVSVFRGLADSEVVDQTSTGENDNSSTASSGATAMTTQADELLIGGIGTEGPDGDSAGTWQDSFTAGPRLGTTGGTDDTNITASLGWRIVSATGSYTASKTGMTQRDHASIIATFKAAPSGSVPRITLTGTPLSAFSSVPGSPSAEQTYTVSGSNLTNDIAITAPGDFQISLTSGGGFGSSLTLPQAGGSVATTTIYVRFNRATQGSSSGSITHASSGATTRNVAVSGAATTPEFDVLLGRPTDHSVTVNVIPNQNVDVYFKYGSASGSYPGQTVTYAAAAGAPLETVIDGLSANTRYYYRMAYRVTGMSGWTESEEYSFITQRAPGSTFTFTIISDSHLGQYGGQTADEKALYEQTLLDIGADHPDFHIDLGDTFAMDPSPLGTGMTEAEADAAYVIQRPYMDLIARSAPIYLAIGNHENEEGWNFDDVFTPPDQSLARVGMKYRKLYYPNPVPDDFYTGNEDPLSEAIGGDTNHEDYYAWTWGDALFVVLDPYHYSMTWPGEGDTYGGEGQDGEVSGDRWGWTLGIKQYLWLKEMLENSTAPYKFVFSHHVTGGATPYGRGGIEAAPYFEWGGRNADGTWGWDTHRPASEGWDVPVHQLMVENGVTAYFHGHDHIYAMEELDGIYYVECPKPDDAGYAWEPYGYGETEDLYPEAYKLPNSGYLRVVVSPAEATVEYVRAYLPGDGTNGQVAHSVTMSPAASGTFTLNYTAGPGGSLSGETSQTVNEGEDGTPVTAVPNTGYHFVDWSDGSTANPRTDTNVTTDVNVTANFTEDPATNEAPVITEGASTNVIMSEDGSPTPFSLTLHATDADTDPITWSISTPASHGTASASGTGTSKAIGYAPAADYNGGDSFVVQVSDGNGGTDTITVNVTINPVNDAPVANAQSVATDKGIAKAITLTGSDPDGDPLTYAIVTEPTHGTLSGTAPNVTYTPDSDYTGDDSFTFKVNDNDLDSPSATVSIVISDNPVPVLPSSFYGEIHISDNPPSAGDLVEAYKPGDAGAVASVEIQSNAGTLVYAINVPGGSKGAASEGDPITFMIGGRVVAMGVWSGGTNAHLDFHPPQAVPGGPYSGNAGSTINFIGSANDWGADAAAYQWDWDNDGTYDETAQNTSHAWAESGTRTIGLKVTDAQGGEGTATVEVNVNAAPVLGAIGAKSVAELVELSFTAIATDDGLPTGTLTFSLANGVNGEVPVGASITSGGAFTWTPTEAQGPDSYTFDVCVSDGSLGDCETITVTVSEVNVAPLLSAIGGKSVSEGSLLSFTATATDSDVPADLLSFSLEAGTSGSVPAGAIITSNGAFTWTPTEAQGPGSYTFDVCVSDGSLDDCETITVTVAEVNVAPLLNAIGSKSVSQGSLLSFTATASDADLPANTLTFSLEAGTSGDVPGGASITSGGAFTWTPDETQAPDDYTFDVCVSDGSLDDCETLTVTVIEATITHSISLVPGWNLVSFNVHPENTDIAAVLSSVADSYDLVYAWDATGASMGDGNWMKYAPDVAFGNSLTNLDEKMGFWIHMVNADTLDVTGEVVGSNAIGLSTGAGGWNLVGYPAALSQSLPGVLSDHGMNDDFTQVYAYHLGDTTDAWKLFDREAPDWANDLTDMAPGWGYWVFVTEDHTWEVAYAAP